MSSSEQPIGPDNNIKCALCEKQVKLDGILLCCKKKMCTSCVVPLIIYHGICPLCKRKPIDHVPKHDKSSISMYRLGTILCSWTFQDNPSILQIKNFIYEQTHIPANSFKLFYNSRPFNDDNYIFEFGGIFTNMRVELVPSNSHVK